MGECGATVNGAANSYTPWNDFGSGDIPMKSDYYDALTLAKGADAMVHIPVVIGAMSFFHSIPGTTSSGETSVHLDACTLAKIFNGKIEMWDDADIVALNPKLALPNNPIQVLHRKKGSSTTGSITKYLNEACPAEWGDDMVGSSLPTCTPPAVTTGCWQATFTVVEGSGGMAEMLAAEAYAIGYLDSGHGHSVGATEIELKNYGTDGTDGIYLNSKEAGENGGIAAAAAAAITAGLIPTDPTATFAATHYLNQKGAAGNYIWPIVACSYIFVRTDLSNEPNARMTEAFLKFVLSAEGQDLLVNYNFVKIPTEMQAVATTALAALKFAAGTVPYQFESSTLKGTGQESHIISAKRRDFFEYEHTTMVRDMETMDEMMPVLAADLKKLDAGVKDNKSNMAGQTMAMTGIALAVISIVMNVVLFCMLYQRNSAPKYNDTAGLSAVP